jgi:hypothetical protein
MSVVPVLFKNSVREGEFKEYIGKPYTPELAREIPYGIVTDTKGNIVALVEVKPHPKCPGFHVKGK